MKNIFVYGTLMFDDVWNGLIGRPYTKYQAGLVGYKRLAVKGENYPALIRSRGGKVDGILIINVKDGDLKRLDRYEGDCYTRSPVMVYTGNRQCYRAETYLLRRECGYLLSDRPWHPEHFRLAKIRADLP